MMIADWARRYFAPVLDNRMGTTGPSPLGLRALELARSQIGRGESGRNNEGPDLDRYRMDKHGHVGPAGAWCAAFGCWYLEGAGAVFKRSHSAKTLFANLLKAGARKVAEPALGDLSLWHRGVAGARTGHWGIVSAPLDGSAFKTIEANRGAFPSKVREYPHELGEALLLGFARLP